MLIQNNIHSREYFHPKQYPFQKIESIPVNIRIHTFYSPETSREGDLQSRESLIALRCSFCHETTQKYAIARGTKHLNNVVWTRLIHG